jgi:hypothetical protein
MIFFFYDFPMGYMSLMIPNVTQWGLGNFILLPNEEDSIDSVSLCNPSGKEKSPIGLRGVLNGTVL